MVYDLSSIQHPQVRVHLFENVAKSNLSGKKRFVHPNGTYYEGIFKNEKLNGFGTILYPTKTFEEGCFENNCLNGAGRIANHKMTFEGQFKNGCLVEGKIKLSDGTLYEGRFAENLLNSNLIEENLKEEVLSQILLEGQITFPNGTIYKNTLINHEPISTDLEDATTENDDNQSVYSSLDGSILECASEFDDVDWEGIAAEMMRDNKDDESELEEVSKENLAQNSFNGFEIIDEKVIDVNPANHLPVDEPDCDDIMEADSTCNSLIFPQLSTDYGYVFEDDLSATSSDRHRSPPELFIKSEFLDTSSTEISDRVMIDGFGTRTSYDRTEEGVFINNQLNGIGKVIYEDGMSLDGFFKDGRLIKGKITLPDGTFYEGSFHENSLNQSLSIDELIADLSKSSTLTENIHTQSGKEVSKNFSALLNCTEVLSETDDQDALDQLNADLDDNHADDLSTVKIPDDKSELGSDYDLLSDFDDVNERPPSAAHPINHVHAANHAGDDADLSDDEWIVLSHMQFRG